MAKDTQHKTHPCVSVYREKDVFDFQGVKLSASSMCWWLGAEPGSLSTDSCDSARKSLLQHSSCFTKSLSLPVYANVVPAPGMGFQGLQF